MVDEEVIQRQDGVSFKLKMKRGSGTNDRDEARATVHGEDLGQARAKADQAKEELADLMESLREVQPDEDDK